MIALDEYMKGMATSTGKYAFIFTDKSYADINHVITKGFVPKYKKDSSWIKKKSEKRRQMILLYAILEDSLLADIYEVTGEPIDELNQD